MALIKILEDTLPSLASVLSFTDSSINDDSIIEIYTDDIEVFPTGISQSGNTVSINFSPSSSNTAVKIFINNIEDELNVEDTLTSTSSTDALSANQGKVLYDLIQQGGGGTGTTDYNALNNKPSINNVTLQGSKSLEDLGINIVDHAEDITYDNDTSGLSADNVQDALDQLEMIKQDNLTIVDNLNSTSATQVLSANQGRLLKDMVDSISVPTVEDNLISSSSTDALSANQGKILNDKINSLFYERIIEQSFECDNAGVYYDTTPIEVPAGYRIFSTCIYSNSAPHVSVASSNGFINNNLHTTIHMFFSGAVTLVIQTRVIFIKEV